jgi:hypothetical protein
VIDKKAYPSPEPYTSAKSLITGYVSSKMDLIGPAERKVGYNLYHLYIFQDYTLALYIIIEYNNSNNQTLNGGREEKNVEQAHSEQCDHGAARVCL